MLFVFFLLWITFNGRLTWEIAAFGVVISTALYAFCCAFLGYSLKKDLLALRRALKILRYGALLISEIVKSNVALTRIVFNRKMEVKPQLITFRTPVTGRVTKCVLADSITLTPGTITVLSEGDELTIHCLDRCFSEGIEDTVFQRSLLQMQEVRAHDA